MPTALSADHLMRHVQALADEIGPRPAGHPEEAQARAYVSARLQAFGFDEIESIPFQTPDTWGYSMIYPVLLVLASNALGRRRRRDRVLGGLLALVGAYLFWKVTGTGRHPLTKLAPRRPSATLIARVPQTGEKQQTVVLLAHVDSNKHRPTFGPGIKKGLLGFTTAGIGAAAGNGIAQLAEGLGGGKGTRRFRQASALSLVGGLIALLADERGSYVDGANDNASAVACVLGLAERLQAEPLAHTEVWLSFTGAEEVGCLGTHALLDAHGETLRDAWFLDFEMVGTEDVAYVTRHSGFSLLNTYRPDEASLTWAATTARRHPELGVSGREMVMGEEVGTLRSRGYRGLCLAGFGNDGWLANWHQTTDDTAHLKPGGLEKAARFAWQMLRMLDAHPPDGKSGKPASFPQPSIPNR
ncbi:MAG: M28 family peptidase [Anaerolineae bacterium]